MSIQPEHITLDTNETITLALDDGDTLTLRTYINGAMQEALVNFIADNVFDGIDYFPSRKTPLLWAAFVQGFVVGDADVLMPVDDGFSDPYAAYASVKKFRIPEHLKTADCTAVADILAEISAAADKKVHFLMDRSHAVMAGGSANTAIQNMEELNHLLHQGSELVTLFREIVSKNQKKLSGLLSKKNVTAFMEAVEKKLDDAIRENRKQQGGVRSNEP